MTPEERKELARQNFLNGYNCSQSVLLAFSDEIDLDKETLLKLSLGFGGGVARLREVCGAVTGAVMAYDLMYGYSENETGAKKADFYARIQTFAKNFENRYGSIVCRELKNLPQKHDDPTPSPRTPEYYHSVVCTELVGGSAEILQQYIDESEKK